LVVLRLSPGFIVTPPELIFAAVFSPRRRFLELTIGPLFNLFSPHFLDVATLKNYSTLSTLWPALPTIIPQFPTPQREIMEELWLRSRRHWFRRWMGFRAFSPPSILPDNLYVEAFPSPRSASVGLTHSEQILLSGLNNAIRKWRLQARLPHFEHFPPSSS